MSLREWLDDSDEVKLAREIVKVKGKEFLVIELDLFSIGKVYSKSKDADGETLSRVMCACVLDPESESQVFGEEEWKRWHQLGNSFNAISAKVIELNGLREDPDEDVKNSEATGS